MNTKAFGDKGEQLAVEFLKNKGYDILHRNFVASGNELDIVAFDCYTNQIVFVEVKTLSDDFFQMPYQEVNMKKQKKIIRAANSYLIRYNIDKEARFDVISIVKRENAEPQIEHIISAFNAFDFI